MARASPLYNVLESFEIGFRVNALSNIYLSPKNVDVELFILFSHVFSSYFRT